MSDNAETATSDDAQNTETAEQATGTETESTPENADVEKWKALSRKNEAAAKQAQKELDEIRKQHETDTERQIREATEKARNETLAEVASDRVADAIRVAAAKRSVNVDALIEGVNPAKFITDDGKPDIAKVNEWVTEIAPEIPAEPTNAPFPDLGQGMRGGTPALNSTQLEDDLKRAVGAQ